MNQSYVAILGFKVITKSLQIHYIEPYYEKMKFPRREEAEIIKQKTWLLLCRVKVMADIIQDWKSAAIHVS